MKLVSLNVGLPRTVVLHGKKVRTAILKEPVTGRRRLSVRGLDGDDQADHFFHGGRNKAAYLYPAEHYPYWSERLGRDLPPAFFGENLTTEGVLEDELRIGDVLEIGTARVRVTMPRTPCGKLAVRVGDPRFAAVFFASGRTGAYLAVDREGELGAGDAITLVARDATRPTIADVVVEKRAKR